MQAQGFYIRSIKQHSIGAPMFVACTVIFLHLH
jgi:hypothetical protein